MTSPISPLQRDKTYYITSGDFVILVENILFRVHRYFFERESVHFQTLFETPPRANEPVPGSSDFTALLLEAVTASQFARFLWVFYNPKHSIYDEATVDEWKSILDLSHRWIFPEVKQLAIRELEKKDLPPVERIELYHRNFVDRSFLVRDYLSLCQRADPLTLKEGRELGLETTLTIARTREEIRSPRSPTGVMMPLTPTFHGPELIRLIEKSFVAAESNGTPADPSVIIKEPIKKPVIAVNGLPVPNGEEKTPTSTHTSGGLAPKPQANKQTEPRSPAQQGGPKQNQNQNQRKEKAKKEKEDQKKEDQLATPTPNEVGTGPKGKTTTTTSQTPEANKKTEKNKTENEGENARRETQVPVAGQQGAGGESQDDGKGNNQETKSDLSNNGVTEGQDKVKPGGTNVEAEAGLKAEGAKTADGVQVAETANNGDTTVSKGDAKHPNGEADKDKMTTATATKPGGGAGPVKNNGGGVRVGVQTNGNPTMKPLPQSPTVNVKSPSLWNAITSIGS